MIGKMKKPLREQIKWKYIDAECQIKQALRWIKEDGTKQYPSAHQITCDEVIEKMEEIKVLLANLKDPN